MREFWVTLLAAGFLLAGPFPAEVRAEGVAANVADEFSLDNLASYMGDDSRDAAVTGVVKTVDDTGHTFTVTVEKKGDVEFRVSPQTRFDSELLGGLIGKELNSGLRSLKTGDTVMVQYLTLPPEKPVAAEVQIQN